MGLVALECPGSQLTYVTIEVGQTGCPGMVVSLPYQHTNTDITSLISSHSDQKQSSTVHQVCHMRHPVVLDRVWFVECNCHCPAIFNLNTKLGFHICFVLMSYCSIYISFLCFS